MNNDQENLNNNIDYNPNRPHANDGHEDTKKVIDTVAKGASEYLAPGVGGKIYDAATKAPVVGNQLNNVTNKAAEVVDRVPGVKNVSQNLNNLGITDAANKAINIMSPTGGNSAASKPNSSVSSPEANEIKPLNHNKGKISANKVSSSGSNPNFRKNALINNSIQNSNDETEEDSETNENEPTDLNENLDNNDNFESEQLNSNDNYENKTTEKNNKTDVLDSVAKITKPQNAIMFIGIGIVIVFFFLLFLLFIDYSTKEEENEYDATCNINETKVTLTNCYNDVNNRENFGNMDIKSYVIGATYAYTQGNDYNDETLKALMIILKTNALSYGSYNSKTQNVSLKSCSINNNYCDPKTGCYMEEEGYYEGVMTYKKASENTTEEENSNSIPEASSSYQTKLDNIYESISNYLFISESYKSAISTLNSASALTLSEDTLTEMESLANSGENYGSILNSLYNVEGDTEQIVNTKETLFLGDSRMSFMITYGVTNNENTIYGGSCRYEWMVGTTKAEPGRSNYPDGGIKGINSLMKEGVSYNIVTWMGGNDITNYNKYFEKFKELANGEWANHDIYVVSVGPVLDSVSKFLKNKDIVVFNENMEKLINESNIPNLHYIDLEYTESSIKVYDYEGIHYDSKEDNQAIYDIIMKNIGETINSTKALYNFKSYCNSISSNASCSTATNEYNLDTFVDTWEGVAGAACTINGLPGLKATYFQLDGTITVGPGITSMAIPGCSDFIRENNYGGYFHLKSDGSYTMQAGDCIPDKVTSELETYILESNKTIITTEAEKIDLELTEYQTDALASYSYNSGTGNIRSILAAYKNNGLEGLWNSMKKPAGLSGLKNRRKSEFYLFVTGDYNHFTNNGSNDYDNYNSENALAHEYKCSVGEGLVRAPDGYIARKTRPLRTNPFYYKQDETNYGLGSLEGECAWYANRRAQEILATMGDSRTWADNHGNGGDFCKSADATSGKFKTSTDINAARPGAVISWSGGDNNYGHVAIVEEVHADGTMTVSQGGMGFRQNPSIPYVESQEGRKRACEAGNTGCFNSSTYKIGYYGTSGYKFNCYIYLLD